MLSNKLTKQEIDEVRVYTKKQAKKIKKEGSTTAGVPGFLTPKAFASDKDSEGTETLDLQDKQYAYSIKPSKEKIHFVKLSEVSYKHFKEDASHSQVQKVNKRILEVSRMLREISRALDHSTKLKEESSISDSSYWKRTNEAIVKINRRLAEITDKARKLANIDEATATNVKDTLIGVFNKAGIQIKPIDIDYNTVAADNYEFDIIVQGEPIAIDYKAGELLYQDYNKEIRLGNVNQEAELVANITKILK